MKQFTDITVLLDRSGSMVDIKPTMESAYRDFLGKHKANPSTVVSLLQFDSEKSYDPVYVAKPVLEAPGLTLEPRGGTPLYDALCQAIDVTGERLAGMPPANRPDSVLFVIITDGEENSSKLHTRADVRARVVIQSTAFAWQFIYLGANQDAFAEAKSYGIPMGQTLNYAPTSSGIKGMSTALNNTVSYGQRVNRSMPVASFTIQDQLAAMDDDGA